MTKNKCPCIDCICVPICKGKMYSALFAECSLIEQWIPLYYMPYARAKSDLDKLISALNPTRWYIHPDPNKTNYSIRDRYVVTEMVKEFGNE